MHPRQNNGSRIVLGLIACAISVQAIAAVLPQSGQEQAEYGVFPKTLWLTTTDERAVVIEDCIQRSAHPELFAVARFKDSLATILVADDDSQEPLHTYK